ncbi:MAG: ammonia-forming cytochrome c nitrite reductase subunit c552 [Desulfobacterales bacterium]|nr:ammonia-forming cytochrome c nitrite reductase subunit c552 [Desulfobacterales bacterium]
MLEKLKAQKRYSKDRGYQMRMAHELKQKFLSDSFIIATIAFFFITFFTVTTASSVDVANSCIQCHRNPAFRITNKKLYKYFRDWELSIHALEKVTCVDCHGGNPKSTDKKKAHGEDIQQLLTPVKYDRISVTCGKCHEENAKNYKKSKHYMTLTEKGGSSRLTPTCVTCHSSINTSIPKPDDIADICTSCHNPVTENHPEVPEFAGYLIERLSFINYYTRYLISKGAMKEDPHFSKTINEEFSELSQIWHTLELARIEEKTLQIRTMLLQRRKELDDK